MRIDSDLWPVILSGECWHGPHLPDCQGGRWRIWLGTGFQSINTCRECLWYTQVYIDIMTFRDQFHSLMDEGQWQSANNLSANHESEWAFHLPVPIPQYRIPGSQTATFPPKSAETSKGYGLSAQLTRSTWSTNQIILRSVARLIGVNLITL